MTEEKTYTLAQAHKYFAIETNGECWDLLGKPDRTPQENERMLYAAYTSAYHWLHAGTPLHHQRGEWMLAHVCTELGLSAEALRHASRCAELTDKHEELMADFDKAYALMALARAHALAGSREEGAYYHALAEKAGEKIAETEDKKIFMSDFMQSNWFGLV